MFNSSLNLLVGLRGVAADERPAAQRWGGRFEVPMILLAKFLYTHYPAENLMELALQCVVAGMAFLAAYFVIGLRSYEKRKIMRLLQSAISALRLRTAYNEGGGRG